MDNIKSNIYFSAQYLSWEKIQKIYKKKDVTNKIYEPLFYDFQLPIRRTIEEEIINET